MFLRLEDVNGTDVLIPIDDIKHISSHEHKEGFSIEKRIKIYSRSDFEGSPFFEVACSIDDVSNLIDEVLGKPDLDLLMADLAFLRTEIESMKEEKK